MRFVLAAMIWSGYCACIGSGNESLHSGMRHAIEQQMASTATPDFLRVHALAKNQKLAEQFRSAGAAGVLLDWNTGKAFTVGVQSAATPGSLLKPFLLSYALGHGIADANTRVYCRRTLHVAGRVLPCSHPNDQPMLDAEGALAASCNTWFAALARRMSAQDMDAVLRQANLTHSPQHFNDSDTRVLTALGLENVAATPLQIATAYRALFLRESHTGTVWNGLRGSVDYGMANNARLKNVEVLGKTGTARNPGEWWSHGWFAGSVPGRFVLVVYMPRGDGGTAAALAGTVLQQALHEGTQ